jgi:hypothetical protein
MSYRVERPPRVDAAQLLNGRACADRGCSATLVPW